FLLAAIGIAVGWYVFRAPDPELWYQCGAGVGRTQFAAADPHVSATAGRCRYLLARDPVLSRILSLQSAMGPRRDHRRLSHDVSISLLFFLGSDAYSNVFSQRNMGPRKSQVRRIQVFHLYTSERTPHATVDPGPLLH